MTDHSQLCFARFPIAVAKISERHAFVVAIFYFTKERDGLFEQFHRTSVFIQIEVGRAHIHHTVRLSATVLGLLSDFESGLIQRDGLLIAASRMQRQSEIAERGLFAPAISRLPVNDERFSLTLDRTTVIAQAPVSRAQIRQSNPLATAVPNSPRDVQSLLVTLDGFARFSQCLINAAEMAQGNPLPAPIADLARDRNPLLIIFERAVVFA